MKVIPMKFLYFLMLLLFLGCEKNVEEDASASSPFSSSSSRFTDSEGSSDGAVENPPAPSGNGGTQVDPQSGAITAGEWSDVVNFTFWKDLTQREDWKPYGDNWQINPQKRYSVNVKDKNGKPIPDALASLEESSGNIIWEGRTDNTGTAELQDKNQ